MHRAKSSAEGGKEGAAKARVISIDERMGIMTIECPVDIQQFEVPIGTKEFKCPVDGTLLIL